MRAAAIIALLLASACSFGEGGGAEVDRPNIVLIIGDDHGYPDFGFMGSPYVETPHLDRLAAEGTVFTHGYNTASICKPSLNTLLTGLYPHQFVARRRLLERLGVRRRRLEWIQLFVTLPRQLAERGYASFQAGKHWEGDYASAGFTDGMLKPGESLTALSKSMWLGRQVPLDPVYGFIDTHADRPFFLWFAPMLPHIPHDATREYRQRYEGRGLVASAVSYYANITRFDDLVGELIAHLEHQGLRERTLVVYLADNGWEQKPHEAHGRTLGGDRGKGSLHEMGARTPIVFCWPGVVPGGVVSDALVSTVDLFPTLLDYAGAPQRSERPGRSLWPLIQDGRGGRRDRVQDGRGGRRDRVQDGRGGRRDRVQDGRGGRRDRVIGLRSYRFRPEQPASELEEPATGSEDFASELEGSEAELEESASGRSGRPIHERSYFLRDRDWWYIWHQISGMDQLYDARRDPRAERDLAAERPEIVERLRDQMRAWDSETRRFLKPPRERLRDDGPEATPQPAGGGVPTGRG